MGQIALPSFVRDSTKKRSVRNGGETLLNFYLLEILLAVRGGKQCGNPFLA